MQAVANELDVLLSPTHVRSDADIAGACLAALQSHAELPPRAVEVTVANGWITLDGTVDWQYQKHAAENAVRYQAGVRGVTDQIRLKAQASAADIKHRIEDAFRRSAELDAGAIVVDTQGNRVVLRGQVRSLAEKDRATTAAWSARGVDAVVNELVVT